MSKFSVRKPYTVIVAVLAVLILGVVSFTRMTTDLLPEMSLPYLVVMTTYPGASPEKVEDTITKVQEASLATVSQVESIQSISSDNYAIVILEFSAGVDMSRAMLETREELDMLSAGMAEGVGSPIMMQISPDMMPIMVAAIDGDGYDTEALSKLVSEEIAPILEGVDGVASVTVSGAIERTENIVISQEKIEKVNQQIQEKIEEQLSEAEKQLLDAKEQLEAGKAELESQMSAYEDGSIQAEQGFLQGKLELLKMEIAMSQSQADLEEQKATVQQLSALLPELEGVVAQLENQNAEFNARIAESEAEVAGLQASYDADKAAYDQKYAEVMERLEALQNPLEDGDSANAEEIAALRAEIQELEQQLTELSEQLQNAEDEEAEAIREEMTQVTSELIEKASQLGELLSSSEEGEGDSALAEELSNLAAEAASLELRRQEIEMRQGILAETRETLASSEGVAAAARTQLEDTKAQLEAANTAIAEAEAALANGSGLITTNQDNLNSQEADTKQQLNEAGELLESAADELSAGEQELNNQLENFDTTKAEALEQAALDGIITTDLITAILTAQNFSMPAGYVTSEDGTEYLVRVGDELESLEELKSLVLFDPGMEGIEPIRLSDVADIYVTDNSGESYARINGNDGLIFSVQKQNTYSTAEVAHALTDTAKEIEEKYPGVHITSLMNQGDYIDMVVDSVLDNLLMGGVLAVMILLLFLKDIKPTFIIACSIPISVIFAVVCMYFSGVTLNLISLSGLAVGVGMLVDNSVVVIENIYRLRSKGASRIQAAVSGAAQVAGAITSSTLTTVCVFFPIVFVEGMTRQLFQDMALTIGYSLMASLIVALTLVPMMASKMLTSTKEKKHSLFDKMVAGYEKILSLALGCKPLVLILALVLLIVSALLAISRGTGFLPESDSYQMSVSLTMPEEATLEDTIAMSDKVIERLNAFEDVDTVGAMLDSTNMGMGVSSRSVTMYVLLKEDKDHTSQELAAEMTKACEDLECELAVSGSTMDVSALGGSGVSVQIRSQDLDDLKESADMVAEIIAQIPGTQNVFNGIEDPSPELHIVVDKNAAMKQGLTVAQIFADLAGGIAEPTSSVTITENKEEYPVLVIDGEETLTAEDMYQYELTVKNQAGEEVTVKLSDVASIEETTAFSSINRIDQKRYLSVTAEIADGYNVGLVSADAEEALADIELPEGTELIMDGENETIMEAMEQMVLMLLLGVVLIYFIMVAQFQSFRSPFIVLFTMPLAATGGFLGLYLTGNEVSVVSMIGFVLLAGIVVNNGIVLVDYVNQLRLEGTEKREALLEAGKTRLRPILMTAITTILGLLPMAFGMGSGSDMMAPIAIVTVGGLIYATLMTLFVVPVIYDFLNRKELKKISEEELEILSL